MPVFLYAGEKNNTVNQLRASIENFVPKDHLVCIENLSNLNDTLRLLLKTQDIIILYIATEHEMEKLLEMRIFMQDVKLILALAQNDPDLITKGILLRPRFLDVIDDDNVNKVIAVLSKMLRAQGIGENDHEKI